MTKADFQAAIDASNAEPNPTTPTPLAGSHGSFDIDKGINADAAPATVHGPLKAESEAIYKSLK